MQAAAQAGIEEFNGIFQERLRGIVREGLLAMFEAEVTALCGESYRPSESSFRRAGSELVTIRTSQGKERVSKRRVRETLPDGREREVRLKSYEEAAAWVNCSTRARARCARRGRCAAGSCSTSSGAVICRASMWWR